MRGDEANKPVALVQPDRLDQFARCLQLHPFEAALPRFTQHAIKELPPQPLAAHGWEKVHLTEFTHAGSFGEEPDRADDRAFFILNHFKQSPSREIVGLDIVKVDVHATVFRDKTVLGENAENDAADGVGITVGG